MELKLPPIKPKGVINVPPREWTSAEDEYLKHNYCNLNVHQLSHKLNRTISSIKNRVHVLQLKKQSNTGRFVKGHKPWNTGKKGLNIGGYKTQFKKGHKPHNTLKNGCITQRYDRKSGKYYKYIRLDIAVWVLYHRYIWEQKHGKLQPGEILRFIDGNTLNCQLSNLMKINRRQHLQLNSNRKKAALSLKKAYRSDMIRQKYGLPLHTLLLTKKYKRNG